MESRSEPRSTCSRQWDPSTTLTSYFVVEAERVSSSELEELAADAGGADAPRSYEGSQVVARLDAASGVRQGQEAELWFNADHLQLFDADSGHSLLVSDGNHAQAGDGR